VPSIPRVPAILHVPSILHVFSILHVLSIPQAQGQIHVCFRRRLCFSLPHPMYPILSAQRTPRPYE
jgi:hypothetical protein